MEDCTPRRHQQDHSTVLQQRHAQWVDVEEEEEVEELGEQNYNRGWIGYRGDRNRHREDRMGGNRRINDLGGIKLKILAFQRKNDPKVYLKWETKSTVMIS